MTHDINEKLSPNFSLKEMCYSDTANSRGIDNTDLTDEQYENVKALVVNLLQPIRTKLGKPIIISSGFRSKRLNECVGGKPTSQHCANNGAAADIIVKNMSAYDLATWIDKNGFSYDQLIMERFNRKTHISQWVHISYNGDKNRHQALSIIDGATSVGFIA